MTENERWNYLVALDDELLIGGVVLSEWTVFIVQQADAAFVGNAPLACVLTAVSAIETHLRSAYDDLGRRTLHDLIEQAPLDEDLKIELHSLRKFRNKWVHVDTPNEDQQLQTNPESYAAELEQASKAAIRTLRKTLYADQWL